MKLVIFDLGRTLEHNDVLLPGALDTLLAVEQMRDANDAAPIRCLISDFNVASTPSEILAIQQEYYAILDLVGIRSHFEPVEVRVTLSTELGIEKPDQRIFRAAIDKIEPEAGFGSAIFITERLSHVVACRDLGMQAIHFKGPGQTSGDVDRLVDAIPIIREFVERP